MNIGPDHPDILSFPPNFRSTVHIRMNRTRGFSSRDIIRERARSPWLLIPAEVNDFSALVFDCLEDIRREREHQALQEELRAKKAAELRAADQARADAEAKAELQQIELEAAKEIQQKALGDRTLQDTSAPGATGTGTTHHRRLEQGGGNTTCRRTRAGEDYQRLHG